MDKNNPYAPPSDLAVEIAPAVSDVSWHGVWRDHDELVMEKTAQLPNVCVKSGVETESPGLKRRYTWHSPWIGLMILVAIFLYLVLAIITTKHAKIVVPLCDAERQKRKQWLLMMWSA